MNLKASKKSHAKAQRREEEEAARNETFTERKSADEAATLCAFAPLRDILPFLRRI